jgi:hypothetical protein
MGEVHTDHAAVLLLDGTVLIASGRINADNTGATATLEIYDSASGEFSNAGSMGSPRADHAATLLQNGNVLITGGFNDTATVVDTAELFVPN